ncbi:TlpA disulfide reductase family protein [Aliiglaciecola sp. CAU 1673]|uniref:TlpA family protein disulfide reductase n=1 Tax=Aliiglaciecola sp. CAU 1673 TaxID=3032595 RepID=UPI0023DAE534|nr:TlpA disulfide reductase family protein [Aliiglaciecola sp. CAU 1673]MDF2177560.1 TlpA disulfide reductase family protein [Aliiglaciecola sp. CAU 1673]
MRQNLIALTIGLLALGAGLVSYDWHKADFSTLGGEQYHWSELQDHYVVINYFAEWCAPCLRELPELNAFAKGIGDKPVKLFGVSFDPLNKEALQDLATRYNIEFELVLPEPLPNLPNPMPKGLPATFIIGPDGKVARQLLGEQTSDGLWQILTQLQAL